MVKNKKAIFLGIVFGIFLSLFTVNAATSFDVDPQSVSKITNTTQTDNGVITITNTGLTPLNLTVKKNNLMNGSNTITLNTNISTITNLGAGNSTSIEYSYATGSQIGIFQGSLFIIDTHNASENITIPITVNITASKANINIAEFGSTIIIEGELDETISRRITFENNGAVDLTNIRFTVTHLEGLNTNDYIHRSDVEFSANGFNLNVDDSREITITLDIPRNIDIDNYEGILTITTNEGYNFTWNLRADVRGDLEIEIRENSADVIRGLLTVIGEKGTLQTGYKFVINNIGDLNAQGLSFELDGDLNEEYSSNTISKNAVTFRPSSVDLNKNRDREIEFRINIPDNQATGNYHGRIRVIDIDGKELDNIRIMVKVIGDVYIQSINYKQDVNPGDNLDVEVKLKNQGSKLIRNVKISATLFDVDIGRSDIHKTSSTFLLNINEEKTENLRFLIPQEARDGSHILEVRVTFENEQIIEINEVNINRPINKIEIQSASVNPQIITCDKQIFTFIRFQNLGKYDKNVQVTSEIILTNIKQSTSIFKLDVDEIKQQNMILDISTLEPGTYTLSQKVFFEGIFVKHDSQITVQECNQRGVIIDETDNDKEKIIDDETTGFTIFGKQLEKNTVYLGSGLILVTFLILLSLFLI